MLCHYWYFKDVGFKFEPHVRNKCHNLLMTAYELKNITILNVKLLKKNFMAPFYGWGSTASRLEPLRGGSLLFTTSSQKFLVLILPTSEG